MMSGDRLNVIALISGGKDSFFNVLHCIHHGHRVVALANLLPASETTSSEVQAVDPSVIPGANPSSEGRDNRAEPPSDLNSFMYQTVGHEIIPLYAPATGLPLYRQPICGEAGQHARDYAYDEKYSSGDETESMTTLLREVMRRHPEANAVSAGAILSTYQRTRVESVALRLGLTPLAYLWKYPILPAPSTPANDAQLLEDMASAGLEARIIKVASAGLGEDHLWECVSSHAGAENVKAALRRFGSAGGAVLGEGGEFETVVVDGPSRLFKRRIRVQSDDRHPVQEGGGTTWLRLLNATLEEKTEGLDKGVVREPDALDARFRSVTEGLSNPTGYSGPATRESSALLRSSSIQTSPNGLLQWSVLPDPRTEYDSIETETIHVVDKIRLLLGANSLTSEHISNTVVIIRNMDDFPRVNAHYGKLFTRPNPPARVTVSCGDLLPVGCSIAIHLTVDPSSPEPTHRHGLHVQSRSYWAPANIGPYSQAIGIPAGAPEVTTGPRLWSIAGQIPLIPSSMELPGPSDTSQQEQVVLSLQHLWRIGTELKIQIWTSAVAFFSRSESEDDMRKNSWLSRKAWRLAHGSPDDDDDDEADGPDPWDLKHNPKYMTLTGTHQQEENSSLPDWSVLTLGQQNEPETCIPPVFAVEVETLPRGAAVEWHAHVGLSQVGESNAEMLQCTRLGDNNGWKAWHLLAKGSDGVFVHTTLAWELDAARVSTRLETMGRHMRLAYEASLEKLKVPKEVSQRRGRPYLSYVDAVGLGSPWSAAETQEDDPAWIPCRSMWSPDETRLGLIALYRVTLKN